jgi:hypothetical protein
VEPDAACFSLTCVTDGGWGGDPDLPRYCNPVEQMGCDVGQKCTWITVVEGTQVDPAGVGLIGCVPDGTVPLLGACTAGPPGETTGFDDCAAGGYCQRGTCQQICTDVPDSCDAVNQACNRYTGVFTDSSPVLGLCDFKCDPVDQTRLSDGAARCGSPESGDPTRACYGYVDIDFTCAPAGVPTNIHYVDVSATVSLNACAPGFGLLPLAMAPTDPEPDAFMCMAYCRPQPTHSAATELANGGGGFACATRGATAPANECRYWTWLDVVLGADGVANPEHEGVGFCLDYARHAYDADGDSVPDTPFASCTTLTEADGADEDTLPDAEQWGCMPQITTAATGENFRNHMRKLLGVSHQPVAPALRP